MGPETAHAHSVQEAESVNGGGRGGVPATYDRMAAGASIERRLTPVGCADPDYDGVDMRAPSNSSRYEAYRGRLSPGGTSSAGSSC